MTDKKLPRRYGNNLVPRSAVGTPKPVTEASEQLRVAALAAEDAFTSRRQAEQAAKAAPRLDADAGIAAVEKGQDPPAATAPEREREAETARQRERAAQAIAARASIALERATREHRDEWLTAQRADAEQRAQDALAAVDDLAATLDALSESCGVVASLQTQPQGRVIEGSRSFKPRVVGFNASDGKSSPAPRLLAELRESIERTVPDPLPGPPTPDEEAFESRRRGMAQLARGGVYVGGDAA